MDKQINHELLEFPPPAYKTTVEMNRDEQSGGNFSYFSPLSPEAPAIHQSFIKPGAISNPRHYAHLDPNTADYSIGSPSLVPNIRYNKPSKDTSWSKRHRYLIFSMALTNTPFIIFFLVDIIGTQFPKSSFYHRALYVTGGASQNGLPFHIIYTVVALLTALSNINFFSRYRKAVRLETRPPNKLRGKFFGKIFLWGLFLIMVPLVVVWPFAAFRIHNIIKPVFPTCGERGFGSSILLKVANGTLSFLQAPLNSNTATISSTSSPDANFRLDLFAITPSDEDISTFFVMPQPNSISPPSLVPRIRDKSTTFHMAAHTYDFNFTSPSTSLPLSSSQYTKRGNFSDFPLSYLSFPSLSSPLHSSRKGSWSAIGNSESPPNFEIVDAHPKQTTLIRTVEGEKGDGKCTPLRMCSAWTVGEMAGDVNIMESVLVVIGRIGVEMMKYGLGC